MTKDQRDWIDEDAPHPCTSCGKPINDAPTCDDCAVTDYYDRQAASAEYEELRNRYAEFGYV